MLFPRFFHPPHVLGVEVLKVNAHTFPSLGAVQCFPAQEAVKLGVVKH